MPIYSGDVKLLKTAVMADVPEGGGAPTGVEIPDGVSNAIMPDVSEVDRAGGRVNFRKVVPAIQTDDTDTYFGGNVIVAEPPQDPLVSITLFSTGETFDTRTVAVSKVESYLGRGSRLAGYLLENHVAGQRSIQIFQRPGTATPNIGRTLVMVLNEEQPTEQVQYVRVISVEVETRTFTEVVVNQLIDFQADVVTIELSDALRYNWPGSPPSRFFAPVSTKTQMRDTIVADAGSYYGAVALALPALIGDAQVLADSVYTQLVPNARTETPSLDQRPAAQRLLTLATTPRLVELAAAPHTMRVRVGQENRGFSWVQILKPLPAPGSLVVNYMALGAWYALYDDGAGNLTGAGVGTVNYTTGSISITLPALPDSGSSIIFSWGEKSAYTSRAGQAGFRAPEFAWSVPHLALKPGTVVVKWYSGGVLKTAADNGSGGLTGSGTGEVNYATGRIFLRPAFMIDAGGQFVTEYKYTNLVTKEVTGLTLDAGGFATITLDDAPAPNSLSVRWATTRSVSSSTGASDMVSGTDKSFQSATTDVFAFPTLVSGGGTIGSGGWEVNGTPTFQPGKLSELKANAATIAAGDTVKFSFFAGSSGGLQSPADGTYRWFAYSGMASAPDRGGISSILDVSEGNAVVSGGICTFSITAKTTSPSAPVSVIVSASGDYSGADAFASAAGFSVVAASVPVQPPPAPTESPTRYGFIKIAYGSTKYLKPGETRALTFYSGSYPDGTYTWEALSPNVVPDILFPVETGTFTVSGGSGSWTITVPADTDNGASCYLVVKNSGNVVLASEGLFQVRVEQPLEVQAPPSKPAIRVRDPLNAAEQKEDVGTAKAVPGMYLGGVRVDGTNVFVSVGITTSEVWGIYYDPPESTNALWSQAELVAGRKSMTSLNGVTRTYDLWK